MKRMYTKAEIEDIAESVIPEPVTPPKHLYRHIIRRAGLGEEEHSDFSFVTSDSEKIYWYYNEEMMTYLLRVTGSTKTYIPKTAFPNQLLDVKYNGFIVNSISNDGPGNVKVTYYNAVNAKWVTEKIADPEFLYYQDIVIDLQ